MSTTLYFDNDADLRIRRVPPDATVQWAVTTMANIGTRPVVPVHANLSGTATWNPTARRFEAVIEGDDITQYLAETNMETMTPLYGIVYYWGQNLRRVIPNVVVRAIRE